MVSCRWSVHRFRVFFLFLFLLFQTFEIAAQLYAPIFKNYTTKDGLPSSQIYQTMQDSKGYMWFATDNGISRFNGNQFLNFTYADGLCVRTLFGIFDDQKERI